MDFKQFMEYMKGMVEAGTKQTVRVEKTMKNNGKILHGLLIMDKEINLTPIIYLEPYYEMYKQGERLEGILEEIINTYLDKAKAVGRYVIFYEV